MAQAQKVKIKFLTLNPVHTQQWQLARTNTQNNQPAKNQIRNEVAEGLNVLEAPQKPEGDFALRSEQQSIGKCGT